MAIRGFPHLHIYLNEAMPAEPNTPRAFDSGTFKDISRFVTEVNGWEQRRNLIDVTGASEQFARYGDSGITQHPEVTFAGPYDDTTDGVANQGQEWRATHFAACVGWSDLWRQRW